jgi:hypothetical protein
MLLSIVKLYQSRALLGMPFLAWQRHRYAS